MPGFLSQYDEVVTVYFDEAKEWWAKVRRYPSRADFKAAQAALISPEVRYTGEGDNATADTRGKVDTGAYQDELVARALIDWNLTDINDAPIPLGTSHPVKGPDETRRAAVSVLPEEPFEKILNSIEGAARRRPKEGEKQTAELEAFRGNGRSRAKGSEVAATA